MNLQDRKMVIAARFQGAGNIKEGATTGEGTWSITGGAGKLKGQGMTRTRANNICFWIG